MRFQGFSESIEADRLHAARQLGRRAQLAQ
jgi:hypothetical protein